MATWQHWNGVDSKSAYASKTAHLPVVVDGCSLVLVFTGSFSEALSSLVLFNIINNSVRVIKFLHSFQHPVAYSYSFM